MTALRSYLGPVLSVLLKSTWLLCQNTFTAPRLAGRLICGSGSGSVRPAPLMPMQPTSLCALHIHQAVAVTNLKAEKPAVERLPLIQSKEVLLDRRCCD